MVYRILCIDKQISKEGTMQSRILPRHVNFQYINEKEGKECELADSARSPTGYICTLQSKKYYRTIVRETHHVSAGILEQSMDSSNRAEIGLS